MKLAILVSLLLAGAAAAAFAPAQNSACTHDYGLSRRARLLLGLSTRSASLPDFLGLVADGDKDSTR
jgi:hypothetical protein